MRIVFSTKIFFFLFTLYTCNWVRAQSQNSPLKFTREAEKPWKISREEFKTRFGRGNDSLNGLVDLYYNKRRNGFIKLAATPVSFYLFAILTSKIFHHLGPLDNATPFLIFAEPFVWTGLSVKQIRKYSRKNLFECLASDSCIQKTDSLTWRKVAVATEKSKFKLNKKEFITRYGQNDTTIAVINLFFRKRLTAKLFMTAPLLAPALTGAVSLMEESAYARQHPATNDTLVEEDSFTLPVFTILTGCLTFTAAVPLTVIGVVRHFIYSRKKLYHVIQTYQQMGALEKKYRDKLKPADIKIKK